MRRKRGFAWYHVLFAVPALALAFGVQYFMRQNYPDTSHPDMASVAKPSSYRNEARLAGTDTAGAKSGRSTASTTQPGTSSGWTADESVTSGGGTGFLGTLGGFFKRTQHKVLEFVVNPAGDGAPAGAKGQVEAPKVVAMAETEATRTVSGKEAAAGPRGARVPAGTDPNVFQAIVEEEPESAPAEQAAPKTQRLAPAKSGDAKGKSSAEDSATLNEGLNLSQLSSGDAKSACMSIEYRGDGPMAAQTVNADWDKVLVQFTEVKNDLMVWLGKHRKGFPASVAQFLENQIMAVRIKRPPLAEEPDLSWRGIGVFTVTGKVPTIHLSPGFVKLAVKQPRRAKFELARLVAQSWSPCEVGRSSSGEAWGPLLSCLQVSEAQACTAGSYSESGWAVSTALAVAIADPGCTVPAFKEPNLAACVRKIPTPLLVSHGGGALEPLWKESRR